MLKGFARKKAGGPKLRDVGGGSPGFNAAWYYASARPNASGVVVDEVMALNLAAIWRAVSVKSGDLTKLPLKVYERLENDGKRQDRSHRIYELLCYPNEDQGGHKLRRAVNAHLVLWGRAYQEIIRDDETGEPLRLRLLDPRWVQTRRDDAGRLSYWLKGKASPWTGRKSLLPENVLHYTGLSLDADDALSPVQAGGEPLGIAASLDRYAGTLWGNGGVPNGVIECPPGWPEDARANFRQSWQDIHGGVSNGNRVAILEEGAKFVGTSFNPEQLQVLGAREYSVVEIARIVGVPPHKLFDMSHDIERGLEESNRDYYETELEPIAQAQADEIELKLLLYQERKKYYVAFDMNSLMRPKALERAQTNEIRMRNGVLTANEWRAEDGQNPFQDDLRIMPLNMQAIADNTGLTPNPSEGVDQGDGPADPEPLPVAKEPE